MNSSVTRRLYVACAVTAQSDLLPSSCAGPPALGLSVRRGLQLFAVRHTVLSGPGARRPGHLCTPGPQVEALPALGRYLEVTRRVGSLLASVPGKKRGPRVRAVEGGRLWELTLRHTDLGLGPRPL